MILIKRDKERKREKNVEEKVFGKSSLSSEALSLLLVGSAISFVRSCITAISYTSRILPERISFSFIIIQGHDICLLLY